MLRLHFTERTFVFKVKCTHKDYVPSLYYYLLIKQDEIFWFEIARFEITQNERFKINVNVIVQKMVQNQ
jgi:hypothetical protein